MADGSQFHDEDDVYAAGEITPPLQAWREEGHGRRTAPDEVWAAVRDDYLAGMSAPEVCDRHGVRLAAMRSRAAREGWRRIDQPWAPRNRLDPDDEGVELEARVGGNLDKIDLRELADVAFRRMMRAVLRGDAVGALRWRRVHLAMQAEEAEMAREMEQDEAIWTARRRYPEVDSFDSSDALDGDFRAVEDQLREAVAAARAAGPPADPPDPEGRQAASDRQGGAL
ncbi:MAG: hypothetical protein Q8J71_00410 [Brevundimonas sp.]|nr:hypothetical protein [Brevundimonas sp.]